MQPFKPVHKWSWDSPKLTIHVTQEVLSLFACHRQGINQSERGGQLFVDISQPDGLWLVRATPPHPLDKSSTTSVQFNKGRCLSEIQEASKEGLYFLGYWHTHPQTIPQLSTQDYVSIQRFVQKNKHIQECTVAVIVGRSSSLLGVRAWLCTPNAVIPQQQNSLLEKI